MESAFTATLAAPVICVPSAIQAWVPAMFEALASATCTLMVPPPPSWVRALAVPAAVSAVTFIAPATSIVVALPPANACAAPLTSATAEVTPTSSPRLTLMRLVLDCALRCCTVVLMSSESASSVTPEPTQAPVLVSTLALGTIAEMATPRPTVTPEASVLASASEVAVTTTPPFTSTCVVSAARLSPWLPPIQASTGPLIVDAVPTPAPLPSAEKPKAEALASVRIVASARTASVPACRSTLRPT